VNIFEQFPGEKKITKLRIPVSGSIRVTKSILKIIDTKEFQRLRGVRQLGPTIFVFPGANHTRFEHSLGVYNNAVLYLEKLLTINAFSDVFLEKSKNNIRIIILSALLHDLGHYPYSHWIEEIYSVEKRNHENRSIEIIEASKELRKYIVEDWKVDLEDLRKTIVADPSVGGVQGLLNSILSSVIDIDKLDYLRRDSVHCGVNYGNGIDMERLIDSLDFVEIDDSDIKKICITDKGKSVLMAILSTRITMYQEIYWHKTVRICDAMFKRFFFEYVKLKGMSDSDWKNLGTSTDEELTNKLFTEAKGFKNVKLENLIKPFAFQGRKLYKLLYRYSINQNKLSPALNKFFEKISELKYPEIVEYSEKLAEKLKRFDEKISGLDVIIEKTPIKPGHEADLLDYFRIINSKTGKPDLVPTQLFHLNTYLAENQQFFIFISDDFHSALKQHNIANILTELYHETK